MKSSLFLSLFGIVAMLSGMGSANAQLKTAVVNMQESLDKYYKTALEVQAINDLARGKQKEIDQRKADKTKLEQQAVELDKIVQDTARNEEARREAYTKMQAILQELRAKTAEIAKVQRDSQAEFLKARQKMEFTLVEEIRGVIATLAKEGGYDLVHDKSFLPKANKAIIYVSENVPDLTAPLIAKLNENAPAAAAPAAGAGTGEAAPN